ncbi:hypothetical protein [Rubritalea tangerina]|uniref:hypothetical protein n=1 Tax=Rubritalea tangerina TaxID=430798 RepID=UPI00360A2E26
MFPAAEAKPLPYEKLIPVLSVLSHEKHGGSLYAPFYLKAKKHGIDLSTGEYHLAGPNGEVEKLKVIEISSITDAKKTEVDRHFEKKGYILRMLVPYDKAKYKDWRLKHSLGDGALDLAFKTPNLLE